MKLDLGTGNNYLENITDTRFTPYSTAGQFYLSYGQTYYKIKIYLANILLFNLLSGSTLPLMSKIVWR
jgi:hypothetical protein